MILWWGRVRHVERDKWMNGFQRYDEIVGRGSSEAAQLEYLENTEGPARKLTVWSRGHA